MSDPVKIYSKEYYDRLKAIESDHWWTLGMTDIMQRLLQSELPEQPPCILDVGCGSGIGLSWSLRQYPQATRIGLDVSEHGIRHCRGIGAKLMLASGDAIPLGDASVDLSICLDVLQHVPDEDAVMKEVYRVTKPGGYFFARTNAKSFAPAPPGSNLFTFKRLKRNCEDAGFKVLRCSRVNAVGSLVAEFSNWRRGRSDHEDHHHDHLDHQHHQLPEDQDSNQGETQDAQPHNDGGYGGGLRLQPSSTKSLGARAKRGLLQLESQWIRFGGRLPFGHSLIVMAKKT